MVVCWKEDVKVVKYGCEDVREIRQEILGNDMRMVSSVYGIYVNF